MKQGTFLGSQIGRWIVFAALVVVLGALLLTIRPLAAQSTGDCEKIGGELTCSYVEHSAGHVYDFHADTAGAEIAWTLVTTQADRTTAIDTHPDHGDFRIDQESGVLTFKSPPNYESPMGGGTANDSNTYMVMVRVEVDTDAGRTTTNQGVTVNVTNKDEDGGVTLNNLQPQVRELLTASLSDPDGSVVESTWKWSSSSSRSSGYTDIAGATDKAYRPVEGDTGMYLRATATYTDGYGAEVDTAMTESVEPVRAETGVDNADPAFGEDNNLTIDGRTAARAIDENTPARTNIGPPVAATDDDLDVLTYSLSGGADQSKFAINAANGQLMTKARLNFETLGEDGQCAETGCVVEVTVKDPLGNRVDDPALDTITVTITVNDLNEAPTVSGPVLLIRHEEGSLRGDPLGVDLSLDSLPDDLDDTTTVGVQATTFGATDPDDGHQNTVRWELSGPDASKFRLSADDTDTADDRGNRSTSHPLRFKASPNFEKPGDANKDNVYEVTVVARDSQLATGSRDVTIRVTNRDEDGSVSLSHIQPEVATSLTASLTDQDGGITGLKWQWMRTTAGDANSPETCAATDPDTDYGKITGKTSSTYRPVPGDVGKCLRVTATYDDTVRNKDLASTTDRDESEPTVVPVTSTNPVRAAVSPNDRPYYEADGTEPPLARVTAYTRYIRENRAADTSVSLSMADAITSPDSDGDVTVTGGDVTATDVINDDDDATTSPDPTDIGFLQYELGGASKGYFSINQATQTAVVIQTKKMLDREDKSRHTVTVKVTDPSGGTATATVTIIVVNEDEAPKIDDAGPMHVEYMENGDAAVASYMAKDPEGKAITWTVLGSDGEDATFDVEDLKVTAKGGPRTMLAFKSAPNYEAPEGGALASADTGKGNIYTVTLRAAVNDAEEENTPGGNNGVDIDDTEMDTVSIMVGVTDVEEDPVFSDASKTLTVAEHTKADTGPLASVHRNVGSPVTAKDSDGEIHLTYSLSGTDAGYFTIVPATGQIKTMMKLDYETKNSFSVVVTATDPTDRSDTINITIEVDDVAEAPDIVPDGVSVSGEIDVDYNENDTAAVGTYTVEGPQATSATWTLEGADSGDFNIDRTGASSMLKFRSSPNFEAPADADTNNTYMVTVKAEVDGDTDTVEVTVMVTNAEEDGTVAMPSASPVVGSEVTAILTDPDGSISGLSWDWHTSSDMDNWSAAPGTETNDPISFTSTYTTLAEDVDKYLRATASYTDGYGSGNSEDAVSAKVLAANVNVAPSFPTATTTRSIAENTVANTDIGAPVVAGDANNDALTYTLEGADAASFRINGSTANY